MIDVYDVAIIGMGAVGTATGFLLAEFTNVQSLLFLEKENSVGRIASDRRTNSQTRHPFGGELNYTPEVMKAIKRYSYKTTQASIKIRKSMSSSTRKWNKWKMSQTAMISAPRTAKVSRPDMSWSPLVRIRSRSRNSLAWAATTLPFQ